MIDLADEIRHLCEREDATVFAHYYQDGEIQELAHRTGDSLQLARSAEAVRTSTVVMCGVLFMAEMVKMLNPGRRVLMPDENAGCSLADSCSPERLRQYQEFLRSKGRRFQTVAYINTSAGVKALADWVVTSGNAEKIIRRIPEEDEILFVPDRHLGSYLEEVTGRRFILWNGTCSVHEVFSVQDLIAMKRRSPDAITLAHPECPENIRRLSDHVCGTEGMIRRVESYDRPREFFIATEANMLWQLQRRFPMHTFHPVPGVTCACTLCPHMARNTPEKLRDCLATGGPEVSWRPEFEAARVVLLRSLSGTPDAGGPDSQRRYT